MQNAQDADDLAQNLISRNVRFVLDHQFSCAFDAPGTAHLRELEQPFHLFLNPVIHNYSSRRLSASM